MGFAKTKVLQPGESEIVEVKFVAQDMASFDWNDANVNDFQGYELEAGTYEVSARYDSHTVAFTKEFTVAEDILCDKDATTGNTIEAVFSQDSGEYARYYTVNDSLAENAVSRTDLHQPAPATIEDRTVDADYIQSLTDEREYFSCMDSEDDLWYVAQVPAEWTQAAVEAVDGKYPIQLKDLVGVAYTEPTVENGIATAASDADSQLWETFMNQLTYAEMKGLWGSTPGAIDSIGKACDANADRPLNLGGTFTWADAPLQAATFNTKLIRRMGQICGEFDLQKGMTGTSGWWGPGSNINRSQFAGRTKEYYSQDAILNGYMAAASISGAQSKGTNVYIKHCALYDSEDMNAGTTVWVDEQTMRENYLAAFKKAMQDGNSAGAMVSCWRIGQQQIVHNYDFITGVFSKEWGWYGEWVTDHTGGQGGENWTNPLAPEGETKYNWTSGNFNSQEVLLRNSGLTIMGGGSGALTGVWDASLRDGKGGVNVTFGKDDSAITKESVEEYYYMRMMALKGLYKAANSKLVANGVQIGALADQVVELKQAEAANVPGPLSTEQLNGGDVEYVMEGALPAGLSLNTSTGVISGLPTEIADAEVTLNAVVDGWIKGSTKITVSVASPWTYDLPKAWAGEEYDGSIASNINAGGTLTYGIASGALPEGLELNAETGVISGTPTEAGDYTFQVSADFASGSGWRVTHTVYVSEAFTLTVRADD